MGLTQKSTNMRDGTMSGQPVSMQAARAGPATRGLRDANKYSPGSFDRGAAQQPPEQLRLAPDRKH